MKLLSLLNPNRSITIRLILVNLLILLAALGGLVLWAGYRLQESIIEEAEHELELKSLIVANGLQEPLRNQLVYEDERESDHEGELEENEEGQRFAPFGDRDLRAIIDTYAEETEARVTVLDRSRRVLYSSDEAVPIHVEDMHPEIVAALNLGEQHDIRVDEWTGEQRLFVGAPVGAEENPEGVVQLSVPLEQIMGRVRQTWIMLVTAAASLAALSILASILLARQVTQPLRSLTHAAERVATGDFAIQLDVERPDELGRLAEAFDHMANEISLRLERERAFVANASHELRSPITAIQLRAELLESKNLDVSERARRYLAEIRDEAAHMTRMLEQLLDLNRIQSRDSTGDGTSPKADPVACLRRVCEVMAPLAEDAGLDLQVHIPDDLPQVAIQDDDLELLTRNLMDNGIKYTPRGGRVWLSARVQEGMFMLEIGDTGVGIPEADLPHIFQRFYRVDKARDRKGSGLGLSMVRTLLEEYQGEIHVQSKEGEGSIFTVRLPLAPVSES
ncbi:MAG: sensor histidine kinase [Caldilineae bacterium]|nr:MAG: sensor histidine kinase [Caldilineae bacterium]